MNSGKIIYLCLKCIQLKASFHGFVNNSLKFIEHFKTQWQLLHFQKYIAVHLCS